VTETSCEKERLSLRVPLLAMTALFFYKYEEFIEDLKTQVFLVEAEKLLSGEEK
jgi:hypothetical protein